MAKPCLFDDDYDRPHELFESEQSHMISQAERKVKTFNEDDKHIFEITLRGIVNTIRKPGKTLAFDRDDLINVIKSLTGAELVRFDLIPEFNRCCGTNKGLIAISHIQVIINGTPYGFCEAFPKQAEFIRSQGISLKAIRARKKQASD
jgi:hypothetical protein